MWRQGDILLQSIDAIPESAKKRKKPIILTSKTTGHQHKILEPKTSRVYEVEDEFVLEVFAEKASLVHPEHDTIVLSQGIFRVWRQREFGPAGARYVMD